MSSSINITHIIGARPHFMKLAPVYQWLASSGRFVQRIVHTGQHYDFEMSGQFISEFGLPYPEENLEVGSKSHLNQMSEILAGLERELKVHRPDMIVVYGDTNSTAAGAIAASKSHIPLAHVEAGLREWDKSIPEEINKLIIDSVTDIYFCPSETGVQNLKRAGIEEGVFLVGDVVIPFIRQNEDKVNQATIILDNIGVSPGNYLLATCHRAHTTSQKEYFGEIIAAFGELNKQVLFILHPRTKAAIDKFQLHDFLQSPNVMMLDPLPFWQTQALIRHADMVLTDSGGIIKEAYLHQTPSIILDRQTEWVEIVERGWACVAGPSKESILQCFNGFILPDQYDLLYETENVSQVFVSAIVDFLTANETTSS